MFKSFFLAGFECATGYNIHKDPIDQIAATQHDRQVDDDYARLVDIGIRGIREGIRWPLIDEGGLLDFSSLDPFLQAARRHRMDVIWDLFHYGYPDDLDILGEEFPKRFARYCAETTKRVMEETDGPYFFTPVNEPSFFSWAAGDAARFAPHLEGRAFDIKLAVAKAAIQGIDAIWSVCPEARIVNVDPICNMVAPPNRPDLQAEVDGFNEAVFQSWDIICGRLFPELGGSREHLDIVGINYYWTNQWEIGRPFDPLGEDDPRRLSLGTLMRRVYERYGGDLIITETSHVGEMRPVWMREMASEVEQLLREKVPLQGVCLYPVLGMPEWHAPDAWTCMGLWDLLPDEEGVLERRPCSRTMRAFAEAQRQLDPQNAPVPLRRKAS